MSAKTKGPFWFAFGWRLIGVALLAVVLWRVGLRELTGVLLAVDPWTFIAGALLATSVLLLRSLRWPPTSNMTNSIPSMKYVSSWIPVVRTRERKMSASVGT